MPPVMPSRTFIAGVLLKPFFNYPAWRAYEQEPRPHPSDRMFVRIYSPGMDSRQCGSGQTERHAIVAWRIGQLAEIAGSKFK